MENKALVAIILILYFIAVILTLVFIKEPKTRTTYGYLFSGGLIFGMVTSDIPVFWVVYGLCQLILFYMLIQKIIEIRSEEHVREVTREWSEEKEEMKKKSAGPVTANIAQNNTGWLCTKCGRRNPENFFICKCGMKKSEIFKTHQDEKSNKELNRTGNESLYNPQTSGDELHFRQYCDNSLTIALESNSVYEFLYGAYSPYRLDRFDTDPCSIAFLGMMDALYRKNTGNSQFNIPKLVNDAIKQSYDQSVEEKDAYLYVTNIITTFNIIYAYYIGKDNGRANFELDPSVFTDTRRLIRENRKALKDHKEYEELFREDDHIVQKGYDSFLN